MKCPRCDSPVAQARATCAGCGILVRGAISAPSADLAIRLSDVTSTPIPRVQTGPWDACFGGGLPLTACILLGGEAGSGKSTLSLLLASRVSAARTPRDALYVSVEMSLPELRAMAARLGVDLSRVQAIGALGGIEGDLPALLRRMRPSLFVLDSVSELCGGDARSVSRVARAIKELAVELEMPALLLAHVNKGGEIAGLMTDQHVVDMATMMLVDDDRDCAIGAGRILYTGSKNRFGRGNVQVPLLLGESGLVLDTRSEEGEP